MLFLLVVVPVSGQRNKHKQQTPEESRKQQVELKEKRKRESEEKYSQLKDRHQDVQTKNTRKMMKRSARKSRRINERKQAPFYQRWFRKKKFR